MARRPAPSGHPAPAPGPARHLPALPQRAAPAPRPRPLQDLHPAAYAARPKATPTGIRPTHERVRRDHIDDTGVVTLRHHGKLHHFGIGRTHARTHVLLPVQDLNIRVINEQTDELLRDLVLDPIRDYQARGLQPGRKRTRSEP